MRKRSLEKTVLSILLALAGCSQNRSFVINKSFLERQYSPSIIPFPNMDSICSTPSFEIEETEEDQARHKERHSRFLKFKEEYTPKIERVIDAFQNEDYGDGISRLNQLTNLLHNEAPHNYFARKYLQILREYHYISFDKYRTVTRLMDAFETGEEHYDWDMVAVYPYDGRVEKIKMGLSNSQAEQELRKLVAENSSAESHTALGKFLEDVEKFDEAITELRIAANLEPKKPKYLQLLTQLLEDQGLYDEAITNLASLQDMDLGNHELRYRIAGLLNIVGEQEKAIEEYKKVQGKFHYVSRREVGCILFSQGRFEDARKAFEYALTNGRSDITIEGLGFINKGFPEISQDPKAVRKFLDSLDPTSRTYLLFFMGDKDSLVNLVNTSSQLPSCPYFRSRIEQIARYRK